MSVLSVLMLLGAGGAALTDLSADRIPNVLCVSVLCTSALVRVVHPAAEAGLAALSSGTLVHALGAACSASLPGLALWAGGAALPLVLFPAFRLRLIGAGDLKLLAALGSCLTPSASLTFLFASLLAGAVFSVLKLLLRRGTLRSRVHFAVPVFAAALVYAGGELLCGS